MSSDKLVLIFHTPADTPVAQSIADALQRTELTVRCHSAPSPEATDDIDTAVLFIPIISAQTEADSQGAFRQLWSQTAARVDEPLSAEKFIMPVAVDTSPESDASVPDIFLQLPWIRIHGATVSTELEETASRLISAQAGDVYFPPIPTGKSLPPFSTHPGDALSSTEIKPPSRFNWKWGGAIVVILTIAGVYFGKNSSRPPAPQPLNQTAIPPPAEKPAPAEAALKVPKLFEAIKSNSHPPTQKPEAAPPLPTAETLRQAYDLSLHQRDYAAAAFHLQGLIDLTPREAPQLRSELALIQFAQRLAPDEFLAAIELSPDFSRNQSRLIALGLQRDFANQRRAIRAGAGALHTRWPDSWQVPEVALTDSYLDEGNWALARHFANQARAKLASKLETEPTLGPLLNAFVLTANRDPESIPLLDEIANQTPALAATANELLIRSLIYQGQSESALVRIKQALSQDGELSVATVLYAPPFDRLHSHPNFKSIMQTFVSIDKINTAIEWVSAKRAD